MHLLALGFFTWALLPLWDEQLFIVGGLHVCCRMFSWQHPSIHDNQVFPDITNVSEGQNKP